MHDTELTSNVPFHPTRPNPIAVWTLPYHVLQTSCVAIPSLAHKPDVGVVRALLHLDLPAVDPLVEAARGSEGHGDVQVTRRGDSADSAV